MVKLEPETRQVLILTGIAVVLFLLVISVRQLIEEVAEITEPEPRYIHLPPELVRDLLAEARDITRKAVEDTP